MIDNSLKYKVIYNQIREKILSGSYKKHQQLPLEKELGDLYDASRITVKKAMDLLVSEGLIIKRRGSGSFVMGGASLSETPAHGYRHLGFSALHSDKCVTSEIIDFFVTHPDDITIMKLDINPADFVYHISRVRCVDGEPHCIEDIKIPISVIPSIRIDTVVDSIYQHIESENNLKIRSQHQILRASRAQAMDVKYLHLDPNDPIFEIEQVSYLDNGLAFEYSMIRYRFDRYEMRNVNISS